MKTGLLYVNEHLQCKNYLSDNKCAFLQFLLKKNETVSIQFPNEYLFVFLLSGKLDVMFADGRQCQYDGSNMYSVGFDDEIFIDPKVKSSFIILTFNKPQILCDEFSLIGLKKYLPEQDRTCRSLPLNQPLLDFFHTMQFYMSQRMSCRHLHDIKQSEWFFLMRGFYTKEQNAMFFYPLIRERDTFEQLVIEKANSVDTVLELAEACNMSPKTLTRKFKSTFDTTPKQWLLNRKKMEVKREILRADSFKEFQSKVGFSSYSHLSDYCMKQFGRSLRDIRDENK